MDMSTRHFPLGFGNFSRPLQHVHTEVDQSVRSCASMSRGKHISHFPIKAMGNVQGPMLHVPAVIVDRGVFAVVCKCESGQARQPFSHQGDGNFSRSLQHVHTEVDQSVRNCASVSRGKHVSNFPIKAMGNVQGPMRQVRTEIVDRGVFAVVCKCESGQARQPFSHQGDGNFSRSLQHVHTEVDQSVRSCASVSRGKHVSNFPIGAMGLLNMSTHIVSFIPVDRGRRYRDRAGRDVDTASLQATSKTFVSHWGDGKFAGVAGTYISLIRTKYRSELKDENRFGHVSHLPMGRWELLKMNAHDGSFVGVDLGVQD